MSVTLSKLSVKQQFNLDKMLKNKKFLHHSIKTYQDKSLKVLKEGLLRSNAKYKIYALQGIIKHILHLKTTNNKSKLLKFINNLIDVDVMEIICQVMATLDTNLLRLLFTLLNYMKLSPKFFEFHRLGPITDSLLRALNIIFKQYRNRSITKCGIKLLTSILNRENQRYFIQHIFKEESLLNFIKKLYSNEYGKKDAHCYQDILTYTLLLYGKYYDTDNCTDVINIAEASIKSLFRKIKSNSFNENEKLTCISLLCNIINLLLRKYVTNSVTFPLVSVISFQIKFLFHFIIVNKEHRLVPIISQCLLKFYDNLEHKYKNELIDYLTKKGILTFLINEREFFMFKNKINTDKVIKKLLVKQLIMLCDIKFNSTHHIKWGKIFNYGFDNLPSDVKFWSSQIKKYNHLEKIQVTIFVFTYFYYTSLPTCYDSKSPHLDQLMITIPSKIVYFTHRMDVIYIKIILFLVSVSMLLNYSENLKVKKYNSKSLNALKKFADSPKYCRKIYTEHKDFIQWIVSESADELPMKMKYDFIVRWINSEKTNNLVLQSAAEKKRRVALLLLMLLVHCEEKTIVSLYNILQNVLRTQKLLQKKDRYLRNIIWSNFILIFNKYKENESIVFNLIAFIHLAIEDVPTFSECQFSTIISLILTSLSAHKLDDKDELCIAFLQLIMKVISEFNKKKKSTEINIFLSDKNFLDFVKCGLFSDNQKVFNLSINLISLIDVVHTRSAVLPEVHIEMNAEDLNLMMRKDVHRALSGIKLFTIGIPSKGLKPLFCISMLSTENVRQIYYNLLNVALTVPDKNEHCYRCLRYILNKHKDNYNLAVLPWTSHLIDYVAKNTNLRLNDIDWLLFLKSWLTALQPAAGLWPTKGLFSYNILATTVEAVSVELIVASSRLNINEFVTIAKLILNLKTRLPNELKMVLKEIASE